MRRQKTSRDVNIRLRPPLSLFPFYKEFRICHARLLHVQIDILPPALWRLINFMIDTNMSILTLLGHPVPCIPAFAVGRVVEREILDSLEIAEVEGRHDLGLRGSIVGAEEARGAKETICARVFVEFVDHGLEMGADFLGLGLEETERMVDFHAQE